MAANKKQAPKRKPTPQKATPKRVAARHPVKKESNPKKQAKKIKKQDYQEAIAAYKVMAETSKGREKKKYTEAIKAFEVMREQKPDNLAKYRQLRASVAEQLKEQGKDLTNEEINEYTKSLYSRLKKQYPKAGDFEEAIRHSESVAESFFEPEEPIVSNKNAFDWWLLHYELTKISANTFIIIDNREHASGDNIFEGQNYNSDSFVDELYKEINFMNLNSDELLLNYLQVFISDEKSNKEIVYFLLLDAGNTLIRGTSYEDILEDINGRYNLKSAFKRVHGVAISEKSQKPKPNKPGRKISKSEKLRALDKLIDELKAEGMTNKDIDKILKAKK